MKFISQHKRRHQAGNAMLEGALVMTLFLMILFGIIDFSRATFAYNSVEYASRHAARWAAVRGAQSGQEASESDIRTQVYRNLVGMDATNTNVSVAWNNGKVPGSYVTVTVNHQFKPIAPYIPTGTWQLQGLSRMVISQ
jgi:Flp pilus assembly protein TadG